MHMHTVHPVLDGRLARKSVRACVRVRAPARPRARLRVCGWKHKDLPLYMMQCYVHCYNAMQIHLGIAKRNALIQNNANALIQNDAKYIHTLQCMRALKRRQSEGAEAGESGGRGASLHAHKRAACAHATQRAHTRRAHTLAAHTHAARTQTGCLRARADTPRARTHAARAHKPRAHTLGGLSAPPTPPGGARPSRRQAAPGTPGRPIYIYNIICII